MIICSALKDKDTNAIFSGVRHADIYEMLYNLDYKIDAIEGFVDNRNNFYDRHEACARAIEEVIKPMLFGIAEEEIFAWRGV